MAVELMVQGYSVSRSLRVERQVMVSRVTCSARLLET